MKLSNRLQCIADQIEKGSKVADIGTDHAYIPVYLVEKGISEFVVAADINEGPLEKAKTHISKNGFEQNIDARLGSGLSVIEASEVDNIIIAGMGGVLISNIIREDFEKASKAKKLVLQPMQAPEELRRYLYENGFEIKSECLAKEEDKIYEIIIASHKGDLKSRKEISDEIYFEVGEKLLQFKERDILIEFLDKKIYKYKAIISNLKGNKTIKAVSRLEFCTKRLKKLKEIRSHVVERNS